MKIYLIKKELGSLWKWSALTIILHFIFLIKAFGQNSTHSVLEIPFLLMSGNFKGNNSPLLGHFAYQEEFVMISLVTGSIFAFFQIYPEIQNKTLQFLLHRPVTKKNVVDAKLMTGICILFLSNSLPLGFIVLSCVIEGNFPAPFHLSMIFEWVCFIFISSYIYLAIFLFCLEKSKWRKLITLLAMPCVWLLFTVLYYELTSYFTSFFIIWVAFPTLILVGLIWYMAILSSFEEKEFS